MEVPRKGLGVQELAALDVNSLLMIVPKISQMAVLSGAAEFGTFAQAGTHQKRT
ncbi:MAG: hypothetical protein ACK6BU_03310 [Cyanobacteriota bacterium]